jgi:hypothetical protein
MLWSTPKKINSEEEEKDQIQKQRATPSLKELIIKAVSDLKQAQGTTASAIYDFFRSPSRQISQEKIQLELENGVKSGYLRKTSIYLFNLIYILNNSFFIIIIPKITIN